MISPVEDSFIVWNSGAGSVQCREMSTLEMKWELENVNQGDCITVAADKGHVYLTDYDVGPPHANSWLSAIGRNILQDATKFLIIANSTSGEVMANMTLADKDGYAASMIISGANDDIFVGGFGQIARIYVSRE